MKLADTADAPMTDYLGRLPIYNHRSQVVAYDILSRSRAEGAIERLYQLLREVGLPSLVGARMAFLPTGPEVFLRPDAFAFPSSKVILQLDPVLLRPDGKERLVAFAESGYQLAVDADLLLEVDDDVLDRLSYATVDMARHDLDALADLLYRLPGVGLKAIAFNVSTPAQYQQATKVGCRFFQGDFFLLPEVVQGRKLPAGRLTVLRLLAQLQSPDTDLKQLETIISQDVSLSYRLLRHLNSAYFGLLKKVESIRHAVVYLGLKNLRVWASIILMAKIEGKPVELMKTSLVRARMCEELAHRMGVDEAETFFTVGLLSTLDVLLDAPMQEVLKELPVSLEIQRALQHREGTLGQVLQCVLDYEAGQWALVDASPYDGETILASYVLALAFAEETAGQLTAA